MKLIIMTIFEKSKPASGSSRKGSSALLPRHWHLHDAKAKFSELVRRVRSEGPQHVTVHGRDEVVVISAEDFRKMVPAKSGAALLAVLEARPLPEIELVQDGFRLPVREFEL